MKKSDPGSDAMKRTAVYLLLALILAATIALFDQARRDEEYCNDRISEIKRPVDGWTKMYLTPSRESRTYCRYITDGKSYVFHCEER